MTTETPGTRNTLRGASLLGPLLLTAAAGVAAVLLGAVVSGSSAAAGAAVGAGLVCAFFALGAAVVGGVARVAPAMSLLVAMLTYLLQVAALALVFVALDESGALGGDLDARWLGGTVVGCTVVWLTTQVVAHLRLRQPLYDLPEEKEAGTR